MKRQISAKTEEAGEPQTSKTLLVNLAKEWATIHDSAAAIVCEMQFGNMPEAQVGRLEIVMAIGTIILLCLKNIHSQGGHEDLGDLIIDMTAALRAFSIISRSYESNPTNEELEAVAVAALTVFPGITPG